MLPGITGIELISHYYYIDMDIPASNIGLQKSADTNRHTTSLCFRDCICFNRESDLCIIQARTNDFG